MVAGTFLIIYGKSIAVAQLHGGGVAVIPGRCSGGGFGADHGIGRPGLGVVKADMGILSLRLQPTGVGQNDRAGGVLQQISVAPGKHTCVSVIEIGVVDDLRSGPGFALVLAYIHQVLAEGAKMI